GEISLAILCKLPGCGILNCISVFLGVCPSAVPPHHTPMGGKILETRTYTRDAAAAALIASLYPDAPPLAFVHSYGCQQNVNDGEKLRGVLQDIGFGLCDTVEQA